MWKRRKKERNERSPQPLSTVEVTHMKSTHSTMLDWQFPSEEEAWKRAIAQQSGATTNQTAGMVNRRRLQAISALLLLIATGATLYVWRRAERGAQMLEDELRATIAVEVQTTQSARSQQDTPNLGTPVTSIQTPEITYHSNIVSVLVESSVIEPNGESYWVRLRHFYRLTEYDWVRVLPSQDILGERRSLETEFFSFSYHEIDAASVEAVAAGIDAIYIDLRQDYGLPPVAERLTIVIHTDQSKVEFACYPPNHLCLPSPALASLPVDLSEQEALQLQLLNALVYRVRSEALEVARFKYEWQLAEVVLPRMQMRRHNHRLSAWHTELVSWLYGIQTRMPKPDQEMLERELERLCDSHQIASRQRLVADVISANLCVAPSRSDLYFLTQYKATDTLGRVLWPDPEWWVGKPFHPEVLAFETLLDYLVGTYGRDALPKLVDGFRRYNTWQTLISAVFGISAEEFERGWQEYLQNLP
jgi:hypothetical protein